MGDATNEPTEVPFWMRAAITQSQLINLKSELARLYKDLEEYRILVEELRRALAATRAKDGGRD